MPNYTLQVAVSASCAPLFCQSSLHSHTMQIGLYLLFIISLIRYCRVEDLRCFNNVKMSELLRLKHSMDLLSCYSKPQPVIHPEEDINATSSITTNLSIDSASALPLTNARSYPEPWQEKPTKLQTLFQVSITALAFLSFGGYLLCLIVQAIKSKGTTYFHPVATTTTATNNGLKKIKVFRRSRRMANITEEVNYMDDYTMAGPNPEELYSALLYFAEGYANSVGTLK